MSKYLLDGQQVEVVAQAPDGFVVRPILDEGDGSGPSYLGEPFIAKTVVDGAVSARYDRRVAELQGRIKEMEATVAQLRAETQDAEKAHTAVLSRLRAIPALSRLEYFIAGRITHYVIVSAYEAPRIISFAETETDKESWKPAKFKLLTLFGTSGGDMEWNLNRYSDGSGSYQEVMPATSHEEAMRLLRAWLKAEGEKLGQSGHYPREAMAVAATQYGVEDFNPTYIEALQKAKRENAERSLAEVEKRRKEILAQLEAL